MANTVDKVIKIAEAEVGYLEKKDGNLKYLYDKTSNAGFNNYTKYGKEMHEIYPSIMDYPAYWCDCFVDWCFYKAYGVSTAKSLIGGNFDDYTVASAQMYKNKNAYYTSNPKVGDQIFFNNGTRICHTGLVYKVTSTTVYTIEGNTSASSGVIANGGSVAKKSYKLSYARIDGYGRPKYSSTATSNVAKPTLKIGSTGSEVKVLQLNLNTLNITDASNKSLKLDGIFGTSTKEAIMRFQKKYKLDVDGIYGKESASKMKNLFK